jgi:hypothetical protein
VSGNSVVDKPNLSSSDPATRAQTLACSTGYFLRAGWNLYPVDERLVLFHKDDLDTSLDFDSQGALWRWWKTVYKARRQFLFTIRKAAHGAIDGEDASKELIDWLFTRTRKSPELMQEAYCGQWPRKVGHGWLLDALLLENQWRIQQDPLDIAVDLVASIEQEHFRRIFLSTFCVRAQQRL